MILAAGQASRFGSCKQLIDIDGQPLLQHVIDAAAALPGDIHIISGHWHNELQHAVDTHQLQGALLHYNPFWAEGMGRSISWGIARLAADYDGILVLLSDQVALRSADIEQLLDSFDGDNIVCSYYSSRRGAPALFGRNHFARLQLLRGDQGARALLNDPELNITTIDLPAAAIDIDTHNDWQAWQSKS